MKGGSPFSIIRRPGFAGARRIFAEVSLPSESKNSFIADLPPGKAESLTGKSVQGVVLGAVALSPNKKTELFTRTSPFFAV